MNTPPPIDEKVIHAACQALGCSTKELQLLSLTWHSPNSAGLQPAGRMAMQAFWAQRMTLAWVPDEEHTVRAVILEGASPMEHLQEAAIQAALKAREQGMATVAEIHGANIQLNALARRKG